VGSLGAKRRNRRKTIALEFADRYLSLVEISTTDRARELRGLLAKHSPVDTGALRASWSDPGTVRLKSDGTVILDNPLPYARIQDTGGYIPPYECPPGKVMVAEIGGETVFFTKRKGFDLPGQHYVMDALADFASQPENLLGPPLKVQWEGGGGMLNLVDIARYALEAALMAEGKPKT